MPRFEVKQQNPNTYQVVMETKKGSPVFIEGGLGKTQAEDICERLNKTYCTLEAPKLCDTFEKPPAPNQSKCTDCEDNYTDPKSEDC